MNADEFHQWELEQQEQEEILNNDKGYQRWLDEQENKHVSKSN